MPPCAWRATAGGRAGAEAVHEDALTISHPQAPGLAPRSANQAAYIEALRSHELVFGIGPAGTGKTYLAVAMAVIA